MTIHELLALTGLTESDEIPVWDAEASGEPTKKITTQNFANAVKTLASLLGTGDVVNNLTSTATDKPLSAAKGTALASKTILYSATSSTSLTPITEGMSVTLSNSLNNYMFLLIQLSTSESNGTSNRGVIMVPAYSVDSNSHYAAQVGSTYGYIRLGNNSGNLRIYSFGGFSELYLYRVIGVMQIA